MGNNRVDVKASLRGVRWIIVAVVSLTVVLSFLIGPRTLSIIGFGFGILSFILLLIIVTAVLSYNEWGGDNFLKNKKDCINGWVDRHRHTKFGRKFIWLKGHRAVELATVYVGATFGGCSLILGLVSTCRIP